MRRLLLFSWIFLFFIGFANANPVDKQTAQQVAVNWFAYKAKIGKSSVKVRNTIDYAYEGMTTFYIFEFQEKGFVIVSADDAAKPVLGYSTENEFGNYEENPALKDWLLLYAKQIKYIRDNNLDNSQTLQEWTNILNENFQKGAKAVDPLLQTTWGQLSGYNTYCPNNTPTGCVATAMAQIMKYYNYPSQGVNQHQYNHPDYGVQSANFESTTYDWDNMPNNQGSDAVALLMYHCGVAVDMDYDPNGSGSQSSWVTYALPNYFKYDQSINYVQKDNYTDDAWIALLKDQLDNSHPILYSGSSQQSGGHAFVCDGYDDSDNFHFNWGWDGYADGYYAIGNLNPAGEDFNEYNSAVINIFPANETKFYAVRKFSDLSNYASNDYPYIDYINAVNDYVAWGIAADGSGNQAYYKIFTKTTDGGLTWQAGTIPSSLGGTAFSMIYGLNADTAYIAMWGTNQTNNKILRTYDGGQNWEAVLTGGHTYSFFNVVHFFDKDHGIVQGDPDTEFEIYYTNDGGDNWTRVSGDSIPNPLSQEYGIVGHYTAYQDTIWFSTNKGRIFKSTDLGHSWTVSTILTPPSNTVTYIKLAFRDGQNGLALVTLYNSSTQSFSYQYYRTSDGGETWTQITNPTGNFYNSDICAVPGTNMFVSVGSDWQTPHMGISYSTDDGQTWTDFADYYKNFQFTAVDFSSAQKGYLGSFAYTFYGGAWMFGSKLPLTADFVSDSLGCVNTDIIFTSTSTGDITSYTWDFGEDATPQTATGPGPHTVQYSSPGLKTVTLTIANSDISKTVSKNILVAAAQPNPIDTIYGPSIIEPNSSVTYSVDNQEYTLFNWSTDNSLWTISSPNNTNEAVLTVNSFNITANILVYPYNGCGIGDTASKTVEVKTGKVEDQNDNIVISPNPAINFIKLVSNDKIENVQIISTSGRIVFTSQNVNNTELMINVDNLEKGLYLIKIETQKQIVNKKLIVQ